MLRRGSAAATRYCVRCALVRPATGHHCEQSLFNVLPGNGIPGTVPVPGTGTSTNGSVVIVT